MQQPFTGLAKSGRLKTAFATEQGSAGENPLVRHFLFFAWQDYSVAISASLLSYKKLCICL